LIEFNEIYSIECRRVEAAFLRLIGEQLTSFEQLKQKVVNKLAKAQFQHEQIRSVRKAKNELEMATSWNRGFTLMYQQLKWLNAFSQLNRIAVNKSVERMAKNFLEIQDNVIDKKLLLKAQCVYGVHFMPERQVQIIEL
jgi:hypothetical protein